MYYDINLECAVSGPEMARRGLPLADAAELARLGFFPLRIEKPDYDPAAQGIEPDGKPAPDPVNPLAFLQRMRVFDLMERHKKLKKEAVAAKRWEYETRGIRTPEGIRVLTDPDSRSRLAGTLQGLHGSIAEIDFKAASGWVTLTPDKLAAIFDRVTSHVQSCYSRERALCAAVDACPTLNELNGISLDEGWPDDGTMAEETA